MKPLCSRSCNPLSFYQMQKVDNENKEKKFQEKRNAQAEADKSSTIRRYFGPINKNKRLDNLPHDASSSHQTKMDDFTETIKWPSQSAQQLEFDTILTLSLVLSNLPFHVIETAGFKMLLNYLCPQANLKSPTTLSKFKLPMIYRNLRRDVKMQIERDIPHCEMAAFTTDGWTARNGDPFVSLTLHYVTKDFELKNLSLDCQNFIGRHTGVLLAQGIDHMISQFPGLQREDLYKVGVTDAAANMKKAITESKEISDHLTCADHLLNTCLTKAVEKSEGINGIIKKCKGLAQRTHQSSLDWQDIKKACVEANIEPVKIIQPIVTRWNSNFMMLKSILRLKAGLLVALETLNKPDLQSLIPDELEFISIYNILPFLAECKRCSDSWSSENLVTMHKVQKDILNLHLLCKRTINDIEERDPQVAECLHNFMKEFEKGLPNYGVGVKYYNVGSLLHPYYRGYTLKNIANSEEGREAAIKELVDNHPTTIQFCESLVNDHTSLETSDLDETMDPVDLEFLKDRRQVSAHRPGTSQPSQSKLKPPLMLEFEKYQTMALPERDVDALEWWKQNKNELPLLAGLARSYLAIPVTSASSERMFSVGGRTVTDFRHNVKPENTSMLVFVSQNYARVPSNLNDWEKTCEEEPYELPHVTPPTKKTHQQGKSHSQTETKKRGAPEKASPTLSDTQTGPEPNKQQQGL